MTHHCYCIPEMNVSIDLQIRSGSFKATDVVVLFETVHTKPDLH